MSRIWFSKGLRGMIAKRIQSDLLRAGFFSGPVDRFVDGDFGGNTESALRALQSQRGLPAHGAVDVETWQQLSTDPLPTLFERCLGMTAMFEGHGFGLLQGNFDGAGLTCGIIGFTLKSNGIQSILAEADAAAAGTLSRVLGPLAPTWQRLVQRPLAEQIAWADSISSGPSKTRVPPKWKDAFARLGDEPIVKRLQMQRAYDKYFLPCARSAATLGLRSELGIELAFDVHVQNGSFKPAAFALAAALPKGMPEITRRRRLANAVADSANPRWVEDVRQRKLTLANGQGSVHGRGYKLAGWGLAEVAAA
ncbi:MAG TPA: peptidoglycan-binding domain-containing protein [Rubrivivax sp.]|nr:peptidoglycan-binding domain-containing protein [Rubrivivax sp.]